MFLRDVTVYLDPGPETHRRLGIAATLAKAHDACLTGVDLSAAVSSRVGFRAARGALRAAFQAKASEMGIRSIYREVDVDAIEDGDPRCAASDLIVVTRGDGRDGSSPSADLPERLLMTAGAPILVLPRGWEGSGPVGRRPIVAWDGSGEATRAAHDALPLLRRSERTSVFVFEDDSDGNAAGLHVFAAHLRRHEVPTVVIGQRSGPHGRATPALLAHVEAEGGDLIVAGAYGHPRVAERLFGGATRELLAGAPVPLLMSH
ncbi:universal stress protein [Lichenibacterium dinghuense]|uniref:universal stress protein n=1 Tax=Lichenibacterium dinghuense TaxID=2895977 RepID=UPI001F1D6498|nr:universal stress protein [Lichenibacterium sp. 6Y81]